MFDGWEFSFGQPWALLGLIAPAALLGWVWRREGRRLVLPYDHAPPRRGQGLLRATVQAAESVPALALTVAVLLLAGPQRLAAPESRRSLTNIQLCVDVSGSMTAEFGEGTRYDAAMQAINEFLDYREGDAFGLTFFGNAVLHWVPLTSDVSAFRCAPPFMDPQRGNNPGWFNGTSIGRALLSCRDVLVAREEGDRLIILISDGYSADLDGGVDMEIAKRLRQDGIMVCGVHVAGGEVPGEVVNIATITGGEMFAAEDPQRLEAVFKRIDAMQKAELEKVAAENVDAFAPWCWAGLGLLALHLLLQLFLRHTPW
ncbi:MAG: vWA domain-containing protein [Planctomycetota bacterium]